MHGFFHQLEEWSQLDAWIDFLDLLFGEQHFPEARGWNSYKVGQFTKAVKRLPGLPKSNWLIGAQRDIQWTTTKHDQVHVTMINGDSEGRAFIRHIRNSIAHGSCRLTYIGKQQFVSVKDYSDNSHTKQTADILLPLEMIQQIHALYLDYQQRRSNKVKKVASSRKKMAS